MKDADVTRAIQQMRKEADAATRWIPAPDVDALIERSAASGVRSGGLTRTSVPRVTAAHERFGSPARALVPRLAAAAALVVVAMGVVWLALPAPLPEGDPPEYIVGLVDSLYSNESYVIDDIASRWAANGGREAGSGGSGYLDSVWDEVILEIESAED